MKILFVLEHFYPYIGGAEKLFYELTTSLAKAGHQIAVVTTLFRPDLPEAEELQGVSVVRIKCRNRYWFSMASLPAIRRMAKDYDVVHTTSYNAALPAWLGASLSRKPVLITFHEVWGKLWWQLPFANFVQRSLFYTWEQLLLKLPFRYFIGVSDYTRQALLDSGIPAGKALRIYNGLDYSVFEAYQHQPPKAFTFTYFGRLGMSKGLELLLPAARDLLNRHPEARFKLIVPTYPKPMYNWVLQQLDDLQIRQQTQLLHDLPRATLYQEIATSSCVVIPSYSEGFCFVAAEAAAMGVPIVSSGRGALHEVVSGPWIPMQNMTAQALSTALHRAFEGNWEQRPFRPFQLQEAVQAYIDLYAGLPS
ncbi:MAG: glycosyltransferase family 4 protein [Phaeodactylibacter sp.]|uniref:glycosyltransferase family 4 protein n=1 Tax=Phaeodactylibacter sp. TaxID=1940289 RepID=UPI0032EBF2B9